MWKYIIICTISFWVYKPCNTRIVDSTSVYDICKVLQKEDHLSEFFDRDSAMHLYNIAKMHYLKDSVNRNKDKEGIRKMIGLKFDSVFIDTTIKKQNYAEEEKQKKD
jgi:hypothetical protein